MRVLIVGSLSEELGHAARLAMARGARLLQADDVPAGLEQLRRGGQVDLVLCDVRRDVAGLLAALRQERMRVPVVACGVRTDAATAAQAIRAGATEFLPLPPDAELIAAILQAAAGERPAPVAEDPAMRAMLARAGQVARSDASVLITGESGTGKEVIARFLHAHSARAARPFVAVNCAAIPDALLESELFGHEKGAFSGAVARRTGKFEAADGGTLLLDEISEMDPRLQAKLLRAVQEREIDRVGGTAPVRVDVRILATSNRNLAADAAAGRFREDLYFRLNVVGLSVPPLRERPCDILPLARHFARHYARLNGAALRALAPATEQRLLAHAWRGNVRELENTMHRAVLLAEGDAIGPEAIGLDAIGPACVGQAPPAPAHGGGLVGRTVQEMERELILQTLGHTAGNRTHAATILGISIRALRNKLHDYAAQGLPVPRPASGVAA